VKNPRLCDCATVIPPTSRTCAGARTHAGVCEGDRKDSRTIAQSQEYILHLHPLAHNVPDTIRLRRALKLLLRGFAFRCTAVEQIGTAHAPDDGEPTITPVEASTRQTACNCEIGKTETVTKGEYGGQESRSDPLWTVDATPRELSRDEPRGASPAK
jgi:hypothetical protein